MTGGTAEKPQNEYVGKVSEVGKEVVMCSIGTL